MKSILATAIAVVTGFIATPNTAEAGVQIRIGTGHTYISGHTNCGCPIYTKRVLTGYDRHHRPVYRYHRQASNCSCHRTVVRKPVTIHRSPSRAYTPPRSAQQKRRNYQATSRNPYRGR